MSLILFRASDLVDDLKCKKWGLDAPRIAFRFTTSIDGEDESKVVYLDNDEVITFPYDQFEDEVAIKAYSLQFKDSQALSKALVCIMGSLPRNSLENEFKVALEGSGLRRYTDNLSWATNVIQFYCQVSKDELIKKTRLSIHEIEQLPFLSGKRLINDRSMFINKEVVMGQRERLKPVLQNYLDSLTSEPIKRDEPSKKLVEEAAIRINTLTEFLICLLNAKGTDFTYDTFECLITDSNQTVEKINQEYDLDVRTTTPRLDVDPSCIVVRRSYKSISEVEKIVKELSKQDDPVNFSVVLNSLLRELYSMNLLTKKYLYDSFAFSDKGIKELTNLSQEREDRQTGSDSN